MRRATLRAPLTNHRPRVPLQVARGLAATAPPDARRLSTRSLPDYNTQVDVANIRLSKPKRPPPTKRRKAADGEWQGLKDLRARLKAEGSMVDQTLVDMESDADFQRTLKAYKEKGAAKLTLEEKKERRRQLDALGVPDFFDFLGRELEAPSKARKSCEVFQLNVGLYCNQACAHCHVESSPKRFEAMTEAVAERCVEILAASPSVHTLDITGGAPELNPQFRAIVEGARRAVGDRVDIIDRCNLTVLTEPGQEDLADFLAHHGVRVVASLPCYSSKNVNQQRGRGVFGRSIEGLRVLNEAGYGAQGGDLHMDLVYNPLGAFLPPPQEALEAKYREELKREFGVDFNELFTMTNMPIKRFADFLSRRGELKDYLDLLVRNFNPDTVDALMCRNTLSVSWDGSVYDCDFNQQLGNPLALQDAPLASVFDFSSTDEFLGSDIRFDNHCFGCTAGMGSS